MTYRHIAFNWRATMGNAHLVSSEVAAYLDLVTSLVEDDGLYPPTTGSQHTCAIDDPIVILDHVRRENLAESLADHRLYDRAVAEVRQHRLACYSDDEIERRMAAADGACPMCGFDIVWHQADSQNLRSQMMHCQHNLGHRVPGDGVDAYLRRPHSWHGKQWPYAFMQGHKVRPAHGHPHDHTAPCKGCLVMEASERVEQAFLKLVTTPGAERFARPGWGNPLSEYVCPSPDAHVGEPSVADSAACNHTYMKVKRAVQKANDSWSDSQELRLNGAGLKLYIQRVRGGLGLREVEYGMRVGGDQVADYPGFQEYAHRLFADLDVLPKQLRVSELQTA